jgi:hypothetical protein
MKYVKTMYALTLAVLPVLLPILAAAQLGNSDRIVAQVPFEFSVANKIFPAGKCIVQTANPSGRSLLINNVAAKMSALVPAAPDETKRPASEYALVFHKYGDHYFLTSIKLAADRTIYRLPESQAEVEMRAGNTPAAEQIVIAALQ